MKEFIKENWFKLSILVVLVVMGFCLLSNIFYKQNQSNTENCRKIGEEYRKAEINDNPSLSFFSPKYSYNQKLNTCIYSGGYLDSKTKILITTKYIKDLNTNEEIAFSDYIGGEKGFGIDRADFDSKEKELFK